MLSIIGGIFYIVAIADFAGMFFGYDFTGYSWTPILFGVIGQVLIGLDSKKDDQQEGDNGQQ